MESGIFEQVANKIEQCHLGDAIDRIDWLLQAEARHIVAFTGGISEYGFRRLLALKRIGLQSYDHERCDGFLREDKELEEWIMEYVGSLDDGRLLLICDSRWTIHPMKKSVYESILESQHVFEVVRERQKWLDLVACTYEWGGGAGGLEELVDEFQMSSREYEGGPYCEEYQNVDIAVRALLGEETSMCVTASEQEFTRYVLGLPEHFPL